MKAIACSHVADQGATSMTGHTSTKGVSFADRVKSLQNYGVVLGENIAYGFQTPKEALLDLAIDDGVPGRGHRGNIFKEDYQAIGTCEGPHKGYATMAVLIYQGKVGSGAIYDEKMAL